MKRWLQKQRFKIVSFVVKQYYKIFSKDERAYDWWVERNDYGFDSRELWSLHNTIAKFIYPRLKAFRDESCGYPGYLSYDYKGRIKLNRKEKGYCEKTEREWKETLDKMVLAFELFLSRDDWDCYPQDKEYKKRLAQIDEGLSLFRRHFNGLWW